MKTLKDYNKWLEHNEVEPLICCDNCSWRRECWEVGCGPQPHCQDLMELNGFSKYKKRIVYRKEKKTYFIIEYWDGSVEMTNYGTVYKKCATVSEAEAALRELCGRLPRKIEEENYQD